MDKAMPRYKKDPAVEDLPKPISMPELKVCQVVNKLLIIPKDTRNRFISDPMFGPEWREMLSQFDKLWTSTVGEVKVEPPQISPVKKENPKTEEGGTQVEKKEEEGYDWSGIFKGEPETIEALKAKFTDGITEIPVASSVNPGLTFMLTPGPCLFIAAAGNDPIHMTANTQPVISHGGGVWLLGEKAAKFQANNPNKGFPCHWSNDGVLVVMEEG